MQKIRYKIRSPTKKGSILITEIENRKDDDLSSGQEEKLDEENNKKKKNMFNKINTFEDMSEMTVEDLIIIEDQIISQFIKKMNKQIKEVGYQKSLLLIKNLSFRLEEYFKLKNSTDIIREIKSNN